MAKKHDFKRSRSLYSTDECIDIEPNQYSLHSREDIIYLLKHVKLECHGFDGKLIRDAKVEYLELLKKENDLSERYREQFLKKMKTADVPGDDAWKNQPCRQRIRNEKSPLSELISKATGIEKLKNCSSKAKLQFSSLLDSSQILLQLEAKATSENAQSGWPNKETEKEDQSKNLYPEDCDNEARESILTLLNHYEDNTTDIPKTLLEEAKDEYIDLVKTEHQLKVKYREEFKKNIENGVPGYGNDTYDQETREFYINCVPSKGPIWNVIDKALDSNLTETAKMALHPYYTLKMSEELMISLDENAPHSHTVSQLKRDQQSNNPSKRHDLSKQGRSASLDEDQIKPKFLYCAEIKSAHESISDKTPRAAKHETEKWFQPGKVYDSKGGNDSLRDNGCEIVNAEEESVKIPRKNEARESRYENVQNHRTPSEDPEGSFRGTRRLVSSRSEHHREREPDNKLESSFKGTERTSIMGEKSGKESYSSLDKESSMMRERMGFHDQGRMAKNQDFVEDRRVLEDYQISEHSKNTSVSSRLRPLEQSRSEPLQVFNKKSSFQNQENKPKEHPGSVPDMSVYIPHPDNLGDYVLKKHYLDVYKSWQMQKSDIDELTNRLSSFASKQLTEGNPNITDLSDKNRPTKIGENFGLIYDDEWSEAFEDLSSDKNISQEILIYKLLRVIRYGYQHCLAKADLLLESLEESFKNSVIDPLSALRTEERKKKVKSVDKLIRSPTHKFAKEYRKTTAQVSAEEVILDFMKSRIIRDTFGMDHMRLPENVQKYIKKCIEQLWFMSVQDPPMYIEYAETGTRIQKEFYKFYERKGTIVKLTVWPVVFLHKDGPLISKGFVLPKE